MMSGDGIDGVLKIVDALQSRVTALEAQARAAAEAKPTGDIQAVRALALKLNQKLTARQREERKASNAAYWLKLFAAHALPTAMLQVNTNLHAAELAADVAFELLAELEHRLEQLPRAIDERKKSQAGE